MHRGIGRGPGYMRREIGESVNAQNLFKRLGHRARAGGAQRLRDLCLLGFCERSAGNLIMAPGREKAGWGIGEKSESRAHWIVVLRLLEGYLIRLQEVFVVTGPEFPGKFTVLCTVFTLRIAAQLC